MKKLYLFFSFLIFPTLIFSQETAYEYQVDIPYRAETENCNRCQLDIYYPTNETDYPTIVWFHGGGLRGGERRLCWSEPGVEEAEGASGGEEALGKLCLLPHRAQTE